MTALFFIGLAAVAIGAGLVYPPAGLIVGGLAAVGVSLAFVRGS